jgi:hypothetical protein
VRALVVYESMFGNTRNVALAIAEGIGTKMAVETVEVGAAPTVLPPDVTLLVVGGPTHIHGMSTPKSRANAAERAGGPVVSKESGMREWLAALRPGAAVAAAAFDTRSDGPMFLTGSAAKGAAKLLRKSGIREIEPPRSFVIDGSPGPLVDRVPPGELEAARSWGVGLAL